MCVVCGGVPLLEAMVARGMKKACVECVCLCDCGHVEVMEDWRG